MKNCFSLRKIPVIKIMSSELGHWMCKIIK